MNFSGLFFFFFSSGTPCHSPNVSLPNVSPNSPPDVSIQRSSLFIIQSLVQIQSCEVSHRAIFLWSVYHLDENNSLLLSRNGSSELQIIPRLLPVGEFLVQLNVSMIGTALFGVSQGYFEVVSSPLVASIAGGSKVARGLERTLIFDASLSYDPDEENLKFLG